MRLINNNYEAFHAAIDLWSHVTTYLGLSETFVDRFEGQRIKALVSGFYGTDFPLWKLSSLLGEQWVEEDVLNGMAELLYFRTAARLGHTGFKYLPTSILHDARDLYRTVPRVYGSNLTSFRQLLRLEAVSSITSSVLHENHFHAMFYTSSDGSLKHGDSRHGESPADILSVFQWLLADIPGYQQPHEIKEDAINLQGEPGSNGSCAIAAHNFIEYRVTSDVPQWTPNTALSFRDQALTELLVYHGCALNAEVCFRLIFFSCPLHFLMTFL